MNLYTPNHWIIMVLGTPQAGTSTFVHTISELDIPIQTGDARPAMDFGRITLNDDEMIYLFSPPASPRYDVMREIFTADRIFGYVQLIDSTAPQQFDAAYYKLYACLMYFWNLPFVFAANKQDEPGAWSLEDIRLVLRIPDEIPIVPCVATDKKSVSDVLIALAYKVLDDIVQAEQTADS